MTLTLQMTLHTLTDKDLTLLEKRVNNEKKLNLWFCKLKLSINYSKTNYIVINKTPHKSVNSNF